MRIINVTNLGIFLTYGHEPDGKVTAIHIPTPDDVAQLTAVGIPYVQDKELSQQTFYNYFQPNQ